MTVNLLVNINSLRPPLTGIGFYTLNILKCLLVSEQINDIKGFDVKGSYSKLELQRMISLLDESLEETSNKVNFSFKAGLRNQLKKLPFAINGYAWLNRYRMQRIVEGSDYIYWEPNYYLFPSQGKSIVTVHDLSHKRYPQYHPWERVKMLNQVLEKSLQMASHICVVSEFTHSELQHYYHVEKNKITVIHPGVSKQFKPQTKQIQQDIVKKYQLNKPYILMIATIEPRKNITGLIYAFEQLPDTIKRHYDLLLVGTKGWRSDEIYQQIANAKQQGWLKQLGYVSQQDLPLLLSAATLMAYPSFYEGFGMPIIEAMASGVPVITSSTASMPEVSGGAAYLIDPFNETSITEALLELLSNESLRQSLIEKGLSRAKYFTWQKSAQQLIESAENLVGNHYE